MTRSKQIAAWVGFIALLVLHHDFWREQHARLVFGWVPEDLVYRIGWIGLSWLYLLWFVAKVWGDDEAER